MCNSITLMSSAGSPQQHTRYRLHTGVGSCCVVDVRLAQLAGHQHLQLQLESALQLRSTFEEYIICSSTTLLHLHAKCLSSRYALRVHACRTLLRSCTARPA
jgi:hypothetical protein